MIEALQTLVGSEHELDHVCRTLRDTVRGLGASLVGAMHVTCSDEAEKECVDAFQRGFVDELLPAIKFWNKSPFHTSNLGGRHEWGSVSIAEQHYATHESEGAFKCLVVKINAHVAVKETPSGPRYGTMDRYHCESLACGALHALIDGARFPFLDSLRESFTSEGKDRVAMLRDASHVDPDIRSLAAAITSARLQARSALLEIQDHRPTTPTLFLVVPCVTFNRPDYDTEFVCGYYTADARTDELSAEYCGLGDDPSGYRFSLAGNRARVEDDELGSRRRARDHRALVRRAWERRERTPLARDARLDAVARDVELSKHHDHPYGKAMLNIALAAMAEIAPIPAVLVLFAEGALGLYQAHRMHKLATGGGDPHEARRILRGLPDNLESLSPKRTREVIEKLLAIYKS